MCRIGDRYTYIYICIALIYSMQRAMYDLPTLKGTSRAPSNASLDLAMRRGGRSRGRSINCCSGVKGPLIPFLVTLENHTNIPGIFYPTHLGKHKTNRVCPKVMLSLLE